MAREKSDENLTEQVNFAVNPEEKVNWKKKSNGNFSHWARKTLNEKANEND